MSLFKFNMNKELKSAIFKSLILLLNVLMIGFAVELASLISDPIKQSISSIGFEEIISVFITATIFFVIIVLIGLISIPIQKKIEEK